MTRHDCISWICVMCIFFFQNFAVRLCKCLLILEFFNICRTPSCLSLYINFDSLTQLVIKRKYKNLLLWDYLSLWTFIWGGQISLHRKTIAFLNPTLILTRSLSSTWLLCTKNITPEVAIIELSNVTLDKVDDMILCQYTISKCNVMYDHSVTACLFTFVEYYAIRFVY